MGLSVRVQGDQTAAAVKFDEKTIVGKDGFFRVGRTAEGQWWLIDAQGKPFYYKGVTSINRAGSQGGRRAKPNNYAPSVDAKYGWLKDKQPFAKATIDRLVEWKFNALGAWTTEEFFEQQLPYTEILEFFYLGPSIADSMAAGEEVHGGSSHSLPDVFDPKWIAACEKKAGELCTPRRDSKLLVGYYTDNEIGFGEFDRPDRKINATTPTVTAMEPGLLQRCLAADPDRPAHKAARAFLNGKYGDDFAKMSQAWGIAFDSANSLRTAAAQKATFISAAYRADNEAWVERFASQYFKVAAESIRKSDPNHLILGCRWGGPPGPAVMAAMKGPWVDVLSANNYTDMMYERIDIYYQATGKPILIGEYNWNTDYHAGIPAPFEKPDTTPGERMYAKGRTNLHRVFEHPGIVGYTWYRWVHNGSGPSADPTLETGGLVNHKDEPWPRNIEALKVLNAEAESIRLAAARPHAALAAGRFTLTLPGGRWSARGDAVTTARSTIGLTLAAGKPAGDLTGDAITGRLVESQVSPDEIRLVLDVTYGTARFQALEGKGHYTVTVRPLARHYEGWFQGEFAGKKVEGPAYLWPEQ